MSFFNGLTPEQVQQYVHPENNVLNYTLTALRMEKKANGVSKLHGEVSRKMWNSYYGICEITSITNAQNKTYWKDDQLKKALADGYDKAILDRNKRVKEKLYRFVANQTCEFFRYGRLTIVWARRFAAYKRAGLLFADFDLCQKFAG